MKAFKIFGWVVVGLLGITALGLALGLVVMGLWNWLMPVLFGLPVVSYWQALGLFLLCHLLFKGPIPHRPPIEHFQGKKHKHPFAGKVREHLGHGCCDGSEASAAE